MTDRAPDLAAIRAAARAIEGVTARTPLIRSRLPGLPAPLWLKDETRQPTGAFKLRGAANALSRLSQDQRARGVVCCSTGNHGRAVAWAARRLGVPATVCLSTLVPEAKVAAVEALGARVLRIGRSQDEAQIEADRLAEAEGLTPIPPFDHPDVIAGQGTIGLELLEDAPDLETILVPLSGGGLAAGVAIAAKGLKPGSRVIGLSMERGAAMHASLRAGRPVEAEEAPSLADSLGGGVGLANRWTFSACRDLLDEVILLSEDEIWRGMHALFHVEGIRAEGAAAVGHAAILAGRVTLTGPTATLITGANLPPEQAEAIAGGRAVEIGDRPAGGPEWTTY
ncbi:MAG: hydroxyectoine utilization dehydratase EutB [Pseudomonadota bacterium]